MHSILARWISAYLIYDDPVMFVLRIRFPQISTFWVLFSFYRTLKDKTKSVLNLNSWKTIYLKIIGMFLSSFWCTTFIFLLRRWIVLSGREKIFLLLLFNWFYVCFSPLFSSVFLRWLKTVSSTFQDVDFDVSFSTLVITWCYNHGIKKLPNHRWTHWYHFCDTIGYHSNTMTC